MTSLIGNKSEQRKVNAEKLTTETGATRFDNIKCKSSMIIMIIVIVIVSVISFL